MTEVITSTPIRQKGRGAKTQTPSPGVDWSDMLPIVSDRVTTFLRVVADRLEPTSAESGYRLSLIAADILMALIESTDRDHVAWKLYDVCALINAARHTSNEKIDAESATVLTYCHEMILAMAIAAGSAATDDDVKEMQQRLGQPMPDLPATPVPTSIPPASVVTRHTHLFEGGDYAAEMMRVCTCDIAPLADAVVAAADDCDDADAGALLRCYGARIKRLNSLMMSYFSEDGITIDQAHREIYGEYMLRTEGGLQ